MVSNIPGFYMVLLGVIFRCRLGLLGILLVIFQFLPQSINAAELLPWPFSSYGICRLLNFFLRICQDFKWIDFVAFNPILCYRFSDKDFGFVIGRRRITAYAFLTLDIMLDT